MESVCLKEGEMEVLVVVEELDVGVVIEEEEVVELLELLLLVLVGVVELLLVEEELVLDELAAGWVETT